MKKRAAISVKMLVTIILLVIGFAIAVLFYVQMDWSERVDREVCHQSVIYRATLPRFAGAKDYVPLKCKTQKMCFTSGILGGECEEFKGEDVVVTVKVSSEEEIEQKISREIIDCWKTMGEGKVEVFTDWLAEDYGVGKIGSSCVVCTRFAFDKEKLEEAGINVSEVNVRNYMMHHKMPESDMSYYGYLAGEDGKISIKEPGGGREVVNINDVEVNEKGEIEIKKEKKEVELGDFEGGGDEDDELAVMFMQVTAPTHTDVFINSVKVFGGGVIAGGIFSPKVMTKVLANKYIWIMAGIFGIYQHANIQYNKAIAASYCGDLEIGSGGREGCSAVRTINYDREDISKYCSVIESIP